ncbi:MAG: triose-phosphate isomerase family protein [Tissierellia bacterium]|nr:triose-phosphate isomerase family protein [Tissierellia bacterium]
MKKIYVNLKRFDVPKNGGGVNSLAPIELWAKKIVEETEEKLKGIKDAEFVFFFPELHILEAKKASRGIIDIGCQGVYMEDVESGKNFGAFTTLAPAKAMKYAGANQVIIGHCEERKAKENLIKKASGDVSIVNEVLNEEIKCALKNDMKVLYCIGEKADEQENFEEVLKAQLEIGLKDCDLSKITIAYEPVWAIGPGKTPPDKEYITKIARFIKSVYDLDVVYGGGLKSDNAKMLSEIEEISGGLIALTRFSGDIGFYPDEYIEIVEKYLNGRK